MASLRFTTADPHDAAGRVLSIFRLLQVPVGMISGEPDGQDYTFALEIPDDPDLADVLVARLSRLVCVSDVSVETAAPWILSGTAVACLAAE